METKNKNEKVLADFVYFCKSQPDLRFWQALSAWIGENIVVGDKDPFYWENKID